MAGFRIEAIPQALQTLRRWVRWKYVIRGSKPEKLPFCSFNAMASVSDETTWNTLDNVLALDGEFDGVGFVFAKQDGLCGIDFDSCRDPQTGKLQEWAREWVLKLDSYAEVSPSGTGVKVIVQGSSPFPAGRKIAVKADATDPTKEPGVEIYDQRRYFCITGQRLRGMPVEPECRQEVIDEFCRHFFPAKESLPSPQYTQTSITERARRYVATIPGAVSGQSGHNVTFHVACVLVIGFALSQNQAFAIMAEWNAKCEPPWTEKELLHKIKGASEQPGERGILIGLQDSQIAAYKFTPQAAPAQREQKPITHVTIQDAANKYLDAVRAGDIHYHSLGIPHLDKALGGGVADGEMIVVAARPSHGKSAIAMQVIQYSTAIGKPCLFVSEEMGALMLGKRALQFMSEVPEQKWNESVGTLEIEMRHHYSNRQPCYIVESVGTANRACEVIRKYVEEHQVKVVAVDYVQLLKCEGSSRGDQIANASVMLRRIASELGIVLIVLAQMNRAIEARQKFIPTMSDIKETGQLEQDADVILFNVWPWKIDTTKNPDEFKIFIAKNRNREIRHGVVTMVFNGARQMFVEDSVVGRAVQRAGLTGSVWNPDAVIKESDF